VYGFLLFLPEVSANCSTGYTMAYSHWPPYHYADKAGNPLGLDVEILTAVFEKEGCAYGMRFVPWKRALYEVKHGTLDVALAASKNAERSEYAWFTKPHRRETMVMFMRAGEEPKYSPKSMSDLAETNYNIGLVLGVWYGEDLSALFRRKPSFRRRVLQKLENKNLFDLLIRGRVDVVVSDFFNGVFMTDQYGMLSQIMVRPEIINDNENHFMFSKKSASEEEVEHFSRAILAFQETEKYQALLLKYIPKEYLRKSLQK